MSLNAHRQGQIQARINQIKKRAAWQTAIEDTGPQIMVTLGTNRGMNEEELMKRVSRALFELDRARLDNTRRPEKHSALARVSAFIMPEKVGLNAHVHLLVFSPMQKRHPQSPLIERIDETRLSYDFLGWGRREYDPHLYDNDRRLAPRLERIWRHLVPGAHYHARVTDDGVATGIDYTLKELPWQLDRDVRLSQEFWRSDQKHIERTLPLNQRLRPASLLV